MAVQTIQVTSINIEEASDSDNFDEVFLFFQADGGTPIRYPFIPNTALPSSDNNEFELGLADGRLPLFVSFEHTLQIVAYEKDFGPIVSGTADFIGSCNILPESQGETVTLCSTADGDDDSLTAHRSQVAVTWKWAEEDSDTKFMTEASGKQCIQTSGYLYDARGKGQQLHDSGANPAAPTDEVALNTDFATSVQQAVADYSATEDGQSLIANAANMSQPELIAALEKMMQDDMFTAIAQAVDDGTALDKYTDGGGVVGSVFVSVGFAAELGVGVEFTASYAMDPHTRATANFDTDPNHYYTLSVTGTATFGGESSIDAVLAFGVAAATPDNMDGISAGVSFSASYGIGVSGGASFGLIWGDFGPSCDPSAWSFTIGPAFGVGLGLTSTYSRTYVLCEREIPAIAQPEAQYLFYIQEIHCLQKQDTTGSNDEIVLQFNLDDAETPYYFPTWGSADIAEDTYYNDDKNTTQIDPNSLLYPGLALNLNKSLTFQIRDVDLDAGNFVKGETLVDAKLSFSPTGDGGLAMSIVSPANDSDVWLDSADANTNVGDMKPGQTVFLCWDKTHDFNEVYYKVKFHRLT